MELKEKFLFVDIRPVALSKNFKIGSMISLLMILTMFVAYTNNMLNYTL